MKRILVRIGILAAIFIASVYIFSVLFNQTESVQTRDAEGAELPVMYMMADGNAVNPMYGYRQEMDESTLRNGVTPLATNRQVTVQIRTMSQVINGLEYQLTDPMDGTVMENGLVRDLSGDGGEYLTGSFTLSASTVMDQEYLLRFSLKVGEETIYYYARVVQRTISNLSTYLNFASGFAANCVSDSLTEEQLDCLETDNSKVNSSYHQADITSTEEQLTWGDLSPSIALQGIPVISEINEETASISLNYMISTLNDQQQTEYYLVDEFYRMRCSQDEVILLDFERETTEYFDSSLPVQVSDGIDLGIVGKDLDYTVNDNGDIAAFVQNGELWTYNCGTNKISKVFSFRSSQPDERTLRQDYTLRVSSVSEAGDIDFVVYGYMPADRYEGKNGITVYQYSAERNAVDEKIFIPVNLGYEYMSESLSRLTYVNAEDQFYFYLADELCMVDLTEGICTVLEENLPMDCIFVSDSQENIAWMGDMDPDAAASFHMRDLEEENDTQTDAGQGEYIRVLGFAREDVVYGLARQEDLVQDISGKTVFPMYKLCIQNKNGTILKEYQQDSVYITDVEKKNDILELKRISRNGDGYSEISDDQIISSSDSADSGVTLDLSVDSRQGTQGILRFSETQQTDTLLALTAKRTDSQIAVTELPDFAADTDLYRVYGYGSLQGLYEHLNDAIPAADAVVGTVLDAGQRYMWERGNTVSSITLDTSGIPEGVLQAPMDMTALQEAVGDDKTALNLCGCTLEEVYYQVSKGYPVVVRLSLEENALMVGYDTNNVWVYQASTGEVTPIASDDATALFALFGNHFMSYTGN